MAILVALFMALGLLTSPGGSPFVGGDVGWRGPSHEGTETPTGTKRAESVLWFNDGWWWGNLWDVDSSDFHIFRFEPEVQQWVDTGVRTEARRNTHHDVLWDGTTLFIASHRFVRDGEDGRSGSVSLLHRFRYSAFTDTYSPLGTSVINRYRTETLVIDKDSTGRVWATWQQGGRIWLNVTDPDGASWGRPFPYPPTPGRAAAAVVSRDDTPALISFGPGRMGLMWTRQVGDETDGFYWSERTDAADSVEAWSTPTPVWTGSGIGDDHVLLKASGPRVFAAVKTSLESAADPSVALLAMDPQGSWAVHPITMRAECANHAIVVLDDAAGRLRIFATYPKPPDGNGSGVCSTSGGAVYEKATPVNRVSFTSAKTLRILDVDGLVHNVVTTKQNVNTAAEGTAGSGLLLLASTTASGRYWHHHEVG